MALIRQYVLPVGSHADSIDEQESTTTPPLPNRPVRTSTPSLPNRPTSAPTPSLPRRPVRTSTPGLPVRPIPSTNPPASSQDIVGLIRQYVLPVGSHGDSSTPTNTPPNIVTPPVSRGTAALPAADSICRDIALVNNPGVNLRATACASAPKTGALPKVTIVNNLGACLDSATRDTLYENQVIQVNKSGTDLLYSGNRYCNPDLAYPPVIVRGSSGNFTVAGALAQTSTYYLQISLGKWDQAFNVEGGFGDDDPVQFELLPGCWDRNPEEITNLSGDLVNKTRRIKIDHPKNKDVTLYLFRFFPTCSYSDSDWQSSLNSGLRGVGAT